MRSYLLFIAIPALAAMVLMPPANALASHANIYTPRVPADQIDAARSLINPTPADDASIARGREVYFGKGLCTTCHSKDGTGAAFPGHRPRNFTNQQWWRTRTDGELMWVLKHGSPGTGMPQRVGTAITEAEGWDVINFIHTFSR